MSMPYIKLTASKVFSLTLIICQLFLVSSFLFSSTALAEGEETPPAETPAEAPAENPDSGTNTSLTPVDPPLAVEPAEPASETPGTLPITDESATSTDIVITDPTDSPDPLEVTPAASSEQSVTLGSSNGGSSAINLAMQNGSTIPRVLSSWAMNTLKDEAGRYLGSDDNADAGAQFLPSGQYQVEKSVALCALISKGSANTKSVEASLYYPENIALSSATTTTGCGQLVKPEFELIALDQAAGIELFCDKLKNGNNNLAIFESGLDYNSLCGPDSLLQTGQARVYCQEQNLGYQDPSGSYSLKISATDALDAKSPIFANTFKYLELTAFAVDFDAINYGPVQLNTPKIIKGDNVWDATLGNNPATVSNVGNTRLKLIVLQNDFGLGGIPGHWNVGYSARIGLDTAFTAYEPGTPTPLAKIMELAETNNLDFGIQVFNFPTDTSTYSGQMTLSAEKTDYLTCQ